MKCIVFFTILVFSIANGTKNNSRMDMSKCSVISCPPIEKPLCAKIKHKNNAESLYVRVVNPCELKLLKCHQDVDGVVVSMKYCDHKASAKTERRLPNLKRHKRSAFYAPGEKLDQELEKSPVQKLITQNDAGNSTDAKTDVRKGNAKKPGGSPRGQMAENLVSAKQGMLREKKQKRPRWRSGLSKKSLELRHTDDPREVKEEDDTMGLSDAVKGQDGLINPMPGYDEEEHKEDKNQPHLEGGDDGKNVEGLRYESLDSHSLLSPGAGGKGRLIDKPMFDTPMFANIKEEEMVNPGSNQKYTKLQGEISEQEGRNQDREKRENETYADEEGNDNPNNDANFDNGENTKDGVQNEEAEAKEEQEFSEPEFKSPQEDAADRDVVQPPVSSEKTGLNKKKSYKSNERPMNKGDSGVSLEAPPDYDSKAISDEAKREEAAEKVDPSDDPEAPYRDKFPKMTTAVSSEDPEAPYRDKFPKMTTEGNHDLPLSEEQDGGPNGGYDGANIYNSQDNHAANYPEYGSECPSVCPSRGVMACGRCSHGVYRTFLSVCHLRMFACKHDDENMELVSRLPCVLSAPYIDPQLNVKPKGRVTHPDDDDKILRFIHCRERLAQAQVKGAVKSLKGISDLKCKFDSGKMAQ